MRNNAFLVVALFLITFTVYGINREDLKTELGDLYMQVKDSESQRGYFGQKTKSPSAQLAKFKRDIKKYIYYAEGLGVDRRTISALYDASDELGKLSRKIGVSSVEAINTRLRNISSEISSAAYYIVDH